MSASAAMRAPAAMSAPAALAAGDPAGLRLLAQLAAALVRPLSSLDVANCPVPERLGGASGALAAHPAFRGAVNRSIAVALDVPAMRLDGAFVERLRGGGRTRLATLLLTQPLPAIVPPAVMLAAAVLHKAVLGLVMKAERQLARAALGEAGFTLATQEAPLLYGPLAAAAPGPRVFDPALDPPLVSALVMRTGLAAFAGFLRTVEPELLPVFLRRLPAGAIEGEGAPLGEAGCDTVVRLMRRRVGAWSALIG